MRLKSLRKILKKQTNSEQAKILLRFFKTGKGKYGEGDKFLGIKVPVSRGIAKEFKDLSIPEIQELLNSEIHEERLIGLFILVEQFNGADGEKKNTIYKFYLKNTKKVNNWDLVDLSAHKIIGAYLADKDKQILFKLAKSKNLWERRIAVMSTFHFIKNGLYDVTLEISNILITDEHDLIHKAVGWMLREIGNRDLKVEEDYLKKYYKIMPRTMLRYAIEKFPEQKRQVYLRGKIKMKNLFIIIFGITALSFLFREDSTMKKNKDDFVPQWAKKVVWYQIFPERFRNGDASNDPTVKDIEGSYPHDITSPWQVHPWTSDWYELQPYEKENGKNIWTNLQRRRYGGDLQGIIDKLDYLQDLGITAIYLNPIFEAPSLHKYDGATFHHIDPNFGPDPNGDRELIKKEVPDDPSTWVWTSADKLFLELVKQVHQRKMHIIIDGVFNHMGLNSWAFKDVVRDQQNSKYKDWFTIKSWDDPEAGTRFTYEGWFGVKELPEIREDENGIVVAPKKYIFDITKRWHDPNSDGNPEDGIDGWRLDVAFCVKHSFWKDWRNHVKAINPESYLTAEVIDSIKVIKPYLEGDEFDAVMNYNFAFTCAEYFISDKTRINTSKFDKLLKELREAFPGGVEYVQQNLFDSHDTNRLLSHIVNGDLGSFRDWGKYYDISRAGNPKYKTRKPNEYEINIAKLMIIFQMTYVGAPMVYYGDEVGMWGANDPDCRKPMVWADLKYDAEIYLPNQSKQMNPDTVEPNKDLFEHYKKLIQIRNENSALQLGDFETVLVDNKKELYAFSRSYNKEKIIVILNNSDKEQRAEIKTLANAKWIDLLSGNSEYQSTKSQMKITIPAKWASILKLN